LRDRSDDREAEPDAAAVARAGRVGAVEAPEDIVGLAGRETGAFVLDLDDGRAVRRDDANVRRRARRRVRADVPEQVVQYAAQPRTAASGVRNSCDASATNLRSRRSDASIRSSIELRTSPRRPTSVYGSARSTRCDRSPPAIWSAVCSIAVSGRKPRRTIQRP